MIRRLSVITLSIALAGVFLGEPARTAPPQRLLDFQADFHIIEALVDGGLALGTEDDPLQRARHCQTLTTVLAEELEDAARKNAGPRATEFGTHLEALLVGGLGKNLLLARAKLPANDPDLKRLGDAVLKLLLPLEERLTSQEVTGLEPARKALAQGRLEIENILKGKTRLETPLK